MIEPKVKEAILDAVFSQINAGDEAAGGDEIDFGDLVTDFIALAVNYFAEHSGSHEHSLNSICEAVKQSLMERGMWTPAPPATH